MDTLTTIVTYLILFCASLVVSAVALFLVGYYVASGVMTAIRMDRKN